MRSGVASDSGSETGGTHGDGGENGESSGGEEFAGVDATDHDGAILQGAARRLAEGSVGDGGCRRRGNRECIGEGNRQRRRELKGGGHGFLQRCSREEQRKGESGTMGRRGRRRTCTRCGWLRWRTSPAAAAGLCSSAGGRPRAASVLAALGEVEGIEGGRQTSVKAMRIGLGFSTGGDKWRPGWALGWLGFAGKCPAKKIIGPVDF